MARQIGRRSSVGRSLEVALGVIAAVGLLVGGIEIAMFVHAAVGPVWLLALFPIMGIVYLAAGLAAWWRRPSNHIGPLMTLTAAGWFVAALANATVPILAALGTVVATVPLALIVWLLHAFPSGRLRSTVSRATVATGLLVATVLQAPLYLFDPTASPDGILALNDDPALLTAGVWIQRAAGLVVMLVTGAVLVDRIRRAPPSHRRVLTPLYAYGTAAVLAVPITGSLLPPLGLSVEVLVTAQIVVLTGVPIAFAVGMLRGGFARTGEVEELGAWLASATPGMGLVQALRRTLGDDSLQLVYWSPQHEGFVGSDGTPIEPPDGGRATVEVTLGGQRIGAIIYDAALIEDPELVRAAGQVAAIAIDHERLTADLRAHRVALESSRARIVEAGDRERRRIAQDLHDGLQVDLVLLAIEAQELANRPGLPAAAAAEAGQLRVGIDLAATELRELVHAVMPAGLVERGLTAAIEDLVDRMPIPTKLALVKMERPLPPPVESTAYFVVAEALANAVKHAGANALAVSLEHAPDRLLIGVTDDGVGGASSGDGAGLRGLADRVDALGGRLTVDSPPGHGTHLLAELPCES
ncbi:MAG: sensor histidine kinase [Chloroflexi bacterium]|nr:sensor histidine kinase [Chloroflexota bacterium]